MFEGAPQADGLHSGTVAGAATAGGAGVSTVDVASGDGAGAATVDGAGTSTADGGTGTATEDLATGDCGGADTVGVAKAGAPVGLALGWHSSHCRNKGKC